MKSVQVINDVAERAVSVATEFIDKITKDVADKHNKSGLPYASNCMI